MSNFESKVQQTEDAEIEPVRQVVGSLQKDHPLNCPVCGAEQPPSGQCRRCRADLEFCSQIRAQVEHQQIRCLALIRQRRYLRATQAAQDCLDLSADERSLRLIVTCYLLQGDFAAAMRNLAKAQRERSEASL